MSKPIVLKINEEVLGRKREFNSIRELEETLGNLLDERVYEVIIKKKAPNAAKMRLTKEDIRRMVRNGEKIPFDFVLVGENQKQHPSLDEIKQHLSLEKPHLIPKMPREELAAWVQIYFFNNRLNNEESVIDHIMRKEIAFQAIQVILDGAAPKGVTVKNERDWIRYFQLEN